MTSNRNLWKKDSERWGNQYHGKTKGPHKKEMFVWYSSVFWDMLEWILTSYIKQSRKNQKIGFQLAISVLGLFFYRWNEKKLSNLNTVPPVERHAFEEYDIHEKFCVQNTLNYSSRQPVLTEGNSFVETPSTDSNVSSEDKNDIRTRMQKKIAHLRYQPKQ